MAPLFDDTQADLPSTARRTSGATLRPVVFGSFAGPVDRPASAGPGEIALCKKPQSTGPGLSCELATLKGLEPSTSAVTGRRSNQLSYNARLSMVGTVGIEPTTPRV